MALSTHDYRPYTGNYMGLGYKTFRIFRSNFLTMVKNKWAIAIMAFSFLFAFIYLMALGLGGTTLTSTPEDIFDYQTDFRLKVTPVDNEALLREVELGDQVSFEFKVRNTGKETGNVLVYGQAPNDQWLVSTTILNGDDTLRPGEEINVRMDVTIPHDMEGFTHREDPFNWEDDVRSPDDGGIRAVKQGFNIGDIAPYIDMFLGGNDISYTFNLFNNSRAVSFYASFMEVYMKDDVTMDPSSEHFDPFWLIDDIRTSSITTLISLEEGEYLDHLKEENITVVDHGVGTFSLEMGSDDKYLERSVKGGKGAEFPLTIENTGDIDILIALDCYVAMYSDSDWKCSIPELPVDPFMGKPYIQLDAGEVRELTLKVFSSNYSIERSFNILVSGTEIGNGSYHHSRITYGIVTVNEARSTDSANEVFYDLTWGNYERYLWLIFLSSVAGAGLISNDIRYNSISLYLSRPIMKIHYLLGKFASLFAMLSLITILPATLFFITGMAFGSITFWYLLEHLWILGAIIFSYAVTISVFTSICMALSSLMKRGIYAGAAIFSLFAFSSMVSGILYAIFDNDHLKLISLHDDFVVVFRVLFDLDFNAKAYGYDWYLPAFVLLCITAVSWATIAYRMKKVEGA